MTAGSRFDLSGRVALVTGASRGIGSAIAEALAEQGAQVVLSSRKQEGLDVEAARINGRFPGKAEAIAAHAGRLDDLRTFIPPRNRALQGTSSYINYLLERDSRPGRAQPLVQISVPAPIREEELVKAEHGK